VEQALLTFNDWAAEEKEISLAGRLMSMRLMGKASFAHLQEETARIQIYFKKDLLGESGWEVFRLLDIGDIIGVHGVLFTTHTGEPTLRVNRFELLAKNLRPLPAIKEKGDEVWFKWSDKEERYRNRALDLVINPDSRKTLVTRSLIVREIRSFLDAEGFLEVETPILQPLYGGAAARPFITHHNSLDQNFYLRIADELYLKRLIAGRFAKGL
jgi:lysyl-tRNA synthetase class 2